MPSNPELKGKKLETVTEITRIINRDLRIETIMQILVEEVRKKFNFSAFHVLLKEGDEYVAKVGHDIDDPNLPLFRVRSGIGITGNAAKNERIEIIQDVSKDPRYYRVRSNTQSELAVPLVSSQGTIGIFNVESNRKNAFTKEDVRILSAVANHLALALEHAQTQKEIDRANKQLKILYETGKLINSSLDLDAILETILKIIDDQLDFKFSAILLIKEDHLYVRAGRGFSLDVVEKFNPKIGQGTPGWCVQHRKPLYIPDVSKDKRYIDVNKITKSALAVPIIYESKAIGAINIESITIDKFSEQDVKFVVALADQAAHAIRNSQQYLEITNFNTRLKSEIKAATQELTRKNEELERLNNVKSEFVSIVSHELRTPLTSIYGYASVIADEDTGPVGSEQKEFLGVIKTESQRLTRLINDLLDISRIESGKMKADVRLFDMNTFMQTYLREVKAQAKEKNIAVKSIIPKKLPTIQADADKIKQIFHNLVGNAIKFTNEGGEIIIQILRGKGQLDICICDNGIGIPTEELSKVFDKFHRVDNSSTRTTGGTGLGLAITRKLVEMHGGTICASSEEGKGSKFCFSLKVD